MRNSKLSWFNIDNYNSAKNFKARHWLLEIEKRFSLQHHYLHEDEALISSDRSSEFYLILNRIKTEGLVNKKNNEKVLQTDKNKNLDYSNKFVVDLSTLEAFSFLCDSDKKNEFESDYKMLTSMDFTQVGISKRHDIYIKYNKPISLEEIESSERFYESNDHLNDFYSDLGVRYLKINLNSSDEMLIAEFKNWLQTQRNSYEIKYPEKEIKDSIFLDWHKNKLLAYWDIVFIAKYEKIDITNDFIGQLLFPDEIEVTLSERVRKVIKPKVDRLFTEQTYNLLKTRVEAEEN